MLAKVRRPQAKQDDLRSETLLHCLVIVARRHGMNLGVTQIIQDNSLPDGNVTPDGVVGCAMRAGLKAKLVRLAWQDLEQMKKALPVIVVLKSGAGMVLNQVYDLDGTSQVALRDPDADEGVELIIDRVRFEEAWSGQVVLVRRDYKSDDEEKPFSFNLILTLILRERRLVRDTAISALCLSIFALTPILFWRLLSDKVLYYAAMSTFVVLCLFMLMVIFFEMIFTYLREFLVNIITIRVDVRLSEYMFERVVRLPIDFFERRQVGLIGHDMHELYRIREFLTGQLFGTVLDSFTLFIFLPLMIYFSPLMTAIVIGFCLLIVGWLLLMLPPLRRATGAMVRADAQRGAFQYQTLNGMRTVKSLALETRQRREWDVLTAAIARQSLKMGFTLALIKAGVKPLERLAVQGAFATGVYIAMTTNDPTQTGALFMFLMLSQRVAGPLMEIAQLINKFDEARIAVAIVGNLVNRPKEEDAGDAGVRTPLKGHVEFMNLRFRYQGSTNYALDGVSFEVPTGTTLGIVGRSGSGKTTVTRLLQRLHAEYEGLIKIDGVDVRAYDVTHLRRSLGVVLQENFLFSGTIRSNIVAAKPHASFEEVVRAARLAGAEEFVDRLPAGYETHIYEGSPNLSGGQRQRLAIARALIVDPRILILDEATSALDPDSEAIVNENIRRIAQGRTVIVISHRLSSLVNSDAILVLERGKFTDMGKHWELLERCEIYSALWNQQNRHIAAAARPAASARGPARVS
jgi:subfamily B ATP-binding cassette protein HlyB/CyaB